MDNILANEELYKDQVAEVKAYKAFDMHYFGFTKDAMGNWFPNDKFQDKKLEAKRAKILTPNQQILTAWRIRIKYIDILHHKALWKKL